MSKSNTVFIFIMLISRLGFCQLDSTSYRAFLKEIIKVKSIAKIFPNDTIFDNNKFIKYVEDSVPGVDSVRLICFEENIAWQAYTQESEFFFGIQKKYIWDTSKYYIIYFFDLDQLLGPDWWLYRNGKIMRKRTWDEQEPFRGKGYRPRNYYEERYRRNGSLKYTGKYKNNKKVETWTYFNRKGKKTKEHKYL